MPAALLPLDPLEYLRVRVADQQRSLAEGEVEVLIAVDVADRDSAPLGEEHRVRAAQTAKMTRDSAGEVAPSLLIELERTIEAIRFHDCSLLLRVSGGNSGR